MRPEAAPDILLLMEGRLALRLLEQLLWQVAASAGDDLSLGRGPTPSRNLLGALLGVFGVDIWKDCRSALEKPSTFQPPDFAEVPEAAASSAPNC